MKNETFNNDEIATIKQMQDQTKNFIEKVSNRLEELYKIELHKQVEAIFNEVYGEDVTNEDAWTLHEDFVIGLEDLSKLNDRIEESAKETVKSFFNRIKNNDK